MTSACFMTSAEPTATSELRRLDAYAALPAVDSFARLTDAAVYARAARRLGAWAVGHRAVDGGDRGRAATRR